MGTGAELCRYTLREAGNLNGLIVGKIAREAGERWGFHALGLPCRGRTYKDSLPQIRQASCMKTSLLLPRSNTENLSNFSSVAPSDMTGYDFPPVVGRPGGSKG